MFKLIDEKQKMLEQRKAWSLLHQEKELEKVRKKRLSWQITDSQVKMRLRALLGPAPPTLELQQPISLALEQCIAFPVQL